MFDACHVQKMVMDSTSATTVHLTAASAAVKSAGHTSVGPTGWCTTCGKAICKECQSGSLCMSG